MDSFGCNKPLVVMIPKLLKAPADLRPPLLDRSVIRRKDAGEDLSSDRLQGRVFVGARKLRDAQHGVMRVGPLHRFGPHHLGRHLNSPSERLA